MNHRGVAGDRFAFDNDVWAEEVGRFGTSSDAYLEAEKARAAIERAGSRIAIRPCLSLGPDATRLSGCAKAYVPLEGTTAGAPFGFVFSIDREKDGRVVLRLIAYGERHPNSSRSVYERAHRRLHGRYQDQ